MISQEEVLISRPDAAFYTIVNDENMLSEKHINALMNYNQTVIPFSHREEDVDDLAS